MEAILDAIPTKVNQNINVELCKPYTDEEIKDALFQMGLTKALGPDGFPALFYQCHWDLMHKEICQAVKSFLQKLRFQRASATQLLCLFPKCLDQNI